MIISGAKWAGLHRAFGYPARSASLYLFLSLCIAALAFVCVRHSAIESLLLAFGYPAFVFPLRLIVLSGVFSSVGWFWTKFHDFMNTLYSTLFCGRGCQLELPLSKMTMADDDGRLLVYQIQNVMTLYACYPPS